MDENQRRIGRRNGQVKYVSSRGKEHIAISLADHTPSTSCADKDIPSAGVDTYIHQLMIDRENRAPEDVAEPHQRDVKLSASVRTALSEYDVDKWYFDTGTNVNITACKAYFTTLQNMKESEDIELS